MEKLLTVSIAAYHVEDYLADCLHSLIIPDWLDSLEVLVINDGAGKEIDRIAMEFVQKYPSVFRLITKENGGYGSTVNRGILEATGRYFKTVDGDDLVSPEGLSALLSFLKTTTADLVVTNYQTFDDNRNTVLSRTKNSVPHKQAKKAYAFSEVAEQIYVNMHAAAFRTALLKGMPERLDEHCFYVDAEYVLFPIPSVKTIAFLEETVYLYRLGLETQSMHIKNMQKNIRHHETVLSHLLQFYAQNRELALPYKKYLAKGAAKIATSQIKIYLSFPTGKKQKEQIRALERTLLKNYPDIYRQMTHPAIRLLRMSRYFLYPLIALSCRKKYRC